MSAPRIPALLRALAAILVRGPEAAFVRADLEDAFDHDLAAGLSPVRARLRFVSNVLGSAIALWRSRLSGAALGFSWLDVKLGVRMLRRNPGLAGVAIFALAIGIPVGLAPAQVADAIEAPLPVDEGHRIQALRFWNTATLSPETPSSDDLARWRAGLSSFEALGAVRAGSFVVGSESSAGVVVRGAEVTASTFEILRVLPLAGRTIGPADEVPGAPDVVVLGHDVWRAQFGSDPSIVGRTIRIGQAPHAVVGVMPEGFLFPAREQIWLPLRLRPSADARNAVGVRIFGRLRDDVSPEQAQAEITIAGRRPASEFPDTTARLEPEVLPFAFTVFGEARGGLRAMLEFRLIQLLALALLVVACTNVGLLIFARTAARSPELAMRTALGAGRARVVSQIFTETLVLALVAAGVGLALLHGLSGLIVAQVVIRQPLPYWMDFGVTASTVGWALALATFSAVVAGVVPALRVTGRGILGNLQQHGVGRSGSRSGRLTGALIVADVAVAVVVVGLVAALADRVAATWTGRDGVGIPAAEYLAVEIHAPHGATPAEGSAERRALEAKVAATQQSLVTRLEAEPGVRGVAAASVLPRMDHPIRWAQLDGEDALDGRGHQIRTAEVTTGFFDALDLPILMGRGFDAADLGPHRAAVIVNTTFVEQVLGGANPIGRRVRYRSWNTEPGPWFEIVGVVGQAGMHVLQPEFDAGLYHPLAFGERNPMHLALHVGDDPESFAPRLREIVGATDGVVIAGVPVALDGVFEGDWYIMTAVGAGLVLLVGILLGLAACGIYAILSFSVERRTREIGVRIALGAGRSDIARAIARRSMIQIALGVLLGLPLAGRIFFELLEDSGASHAAMTGSVLALALGVGLIVVLGLVACLGPTLRALRISPIDALRAD